MVSTCAFVVGCWEVLHCFSTSDYLQPSYSSDDHLSQPKEEVARTTETKEQYTLMNKRVMCFDLWSRVVEQGRYAVDTNSSGSYGKEEKRAYAALRTRRQSHAFCTPYPNSKSVRFDWCVKSIIAVSKDAAKVRKTCGG